MQFINEVFGYPLGWIMYFCYKVIKDYGFALILFTFIMKLAILPLAVKQQKSMAKMAVFSPRIKEIQTKYANNKEKMNEEMMNLYTKEGYNPLSSCLPTLIQFPILFGLIDVIYKPLTHILRVSKETIASAIDIAQTINPDIAKSYSQEIFLIETVKTNPDAFSALGSDFIHSINQFSLEFLGIFNLGQVPQFAFNILILIPIISGIASYFMSVISMKNSSATQPEAGAGVMKGMMLMMPLMSIWIAFQVPAGVGLYWIMSSVFSIIQTIILHKVYNPKEMAEKAKIQMEERREQERKEKIELKKQAKEIGETGVTKEIETKALSSKEISRIKLAKARKEQAEKYGEEYIEEDGDIK